MIHMTTVISHLCTKCGVSLVCRTRLARCADRLKGIFSPGGCLVYLRCTPTGPHLDDVPTAEFAADTCKNASDFQT